MNIENRPKTERNFIRSLSTEEINDEIRAERLKNRERTEKIEGYMGSSQLKNMILNNGGRDVNFSKQDEKPHNKNYSSVNNAIRSDRDEKHFLPNHHHTFDNKRGFYKK
jgi:hypothetical protein